MKKVLVTGGAGFIGSRISELLIQEGISVVAVDDLSTGKISNLDNIINHSSFKIIIGDVRSLDVCIEASSGCDVIIHQAALVSVPLSIEEPILNNEKNINGFLNILEAARINKIGRVVYASSSAVYGDNNDRTKKESNIGDAISPYALSKYVDELYAKLYSNLYGISTIGLRYFNVYGPKQDPSSVYSGVISIFMKRVINDECLKIFGDGSVTRDFIYVDDVAKANIIAAKSNIFNDVFNIGTGNEISIKQLAELIIEISSKDINIEYLPSRVGDILYSCADVTRANNILGFSATVKVFEGLNQIYLELSKK